MPVLYAYFDESGKFVNQDIVAFGGVCGDLSQMEKFDRLWRRELRKARLPALKMSRAMKNEVALSEVIPAQSVKDRIKALRPFALCIRDHAEHALGLAIDVAAFRDLPKRTRMVLGSLDDPHYVMFLRTLTHLLDYAPNDHVSLVCDDEEQTAEPCYKYYRRVKKVYPPAERLGGIGFADDEAFPVLQAADMMASLVRLEAGKRFFYRDFDYWELLELFRDRNVLHAAFLDRALLHGLIADADEASRAASSSSSS
jgi:hypothetical protein